MIQWFVTFTFVDASNKVTRTVESEVWKPTLEEARKWAWSEGQKLAENEEGFTYEVR